MKYILVALLASLCATSAASFDKAKEIYVPSEMHLLFGRPALIDCHIQAKHPPPANIGWRKDSILINAINSQGIYYCGNGSLYFTKVDETHNGRYTCYAYNKLGSQGPSTPIQVTVQRPPVFVITPHNQYLRKLGETIEMPCDARDGQSEHRPIIIVWSKKDGTSLPVGRYSIKDGNLTIINIQEEDRGLYQCSATNKAATITAEAELLVGNIPSSSAPYNLTAVSSVSSVHLSWHAGRQRNDLNCSVWYRPGELSEWRTLQVNSTRSLEANVTDLDSGSEYEFMVLCKDDNGDALFSKSIRVRTEDMEEVDNDRFIGENLLLAISPVNRTLLEGEEAQFTCLTNSPEFKASWFKNGKPLQEFKDLMNRSYITKENTLVINQTDMEDSGEYECEVVNVDGERQTGRAYLDVQYKAKVIYVPSAMNLLFGRPAFIDCHIQANPPATNIGWRKDSILINNINTQGISHFGNGRLDFTKVDETHNGRYTCYAYNRLGSQGPSTPIQVTVQRPPVFVIKPDNLNFRILGKTIEMPCNARDGENGHRPIIISWNKKDGSSLPVGRYSIKDGNLTIINIQEEDRGLYQCSATNKAATITAEAQLLVLIKPYSIAPYNLTAVSSATSVHLSWQAERQRNDLHYSVWYRPVELSEWQTLQVNSTRNLEATVTNLDSGSEYDFTVLCEKENGDGLFSKWIRVRTLGGNLLIAILPIDRTLLEGEEAQFTCLTKSPEFKASWFKDGKPLQEFQNLMHRSYITKENTLVINQTDMEDSGQYECEVVNVDGERQTGIGYLDVQYKAKVIYVPSEMNLLYGRSAVIDCQYQANPPTTTIGWRKDSILINAINDQGIFYCGNGSLSFTKVDETNNGNYTCTANNKLGTQGPSRPIHVTVQRPPVFVITPHNLYLRKLGETIEMLCDARDGENGHRPIIVWNKKDGTSLPVGRYSIKNGNLTIIHIQEEDRGVYRCTTTNKVATITAEAELFVENIPSSSASYNLTAVSSATSVHLSLQAERQRNDLHYSIWYRPDDLSEWKTFQVISTKSLEATVNNLDSGSEYEFMILGKDDNGDGLFSKSIRVRTKDMEGVENGRFTGGNLLIAIPPVNQTLLEGEEAQFTCLTKSPKFKASWFKDGKPLQEFQDLMHRSYITKENTLIINQTDMEDSGQYECEVMNVDGERQTGRACLDVQYKAKVLYVPSEMNLLFGRPALIDCRFQANPPTTNIGWRKDSILIDAYNASIYQGIFYCGNGSLYFTKVDETHNGNYTCTAFNELGTQGPSTPIQVTVQRPPVFVITPQNLYLRKLGETIKMPCDARDGENGHRPLIVWNKKDGTSLPIGRYTIKNGNLTIINIQEEDRGVYRCSTTNKVATITAEAELFVENIPSSSVSYNLTAVSSATSVHFSLQAERQKNDLHYSISYRPDDLSEWKPFQVISTKSLEATVTNLNPGSEYEFMVLYKNDNGDGLFSKSIHVRTQDMEGVENDRFRGGSISPVLKD